MSVRPTICLNMIVKNEAPVIRRCLDSVRPLIDAWLIVDTGSTDGTQEIIREHFRDLPGEVVERPWVDFAHNRTEALALARDRADYSLIIDADEILEWAPDFRLPDLTTDSCNAEVRYGGYSYMRKMLVKNTLPWRYEGVLHEYLRCDEATSEQYINGMYTLPHHDGARARDPLTYRRDALLLEKVLLDDPQNARYIFYLAQSYRDAGDHELALRHYKRRVAAGGWPEEVWYSMYQIAQIEERQQKPWPETMEHYLHAYQYRPDRAEPLFRIGAYYEARKQYALAYFFMAEAMRIPYPAHDRLFVERSVYELQLPIEYAVTCFHTGHHAEAIETCNKLLRSPDLPPELLDKITHNRRFSVDALAPRTPDAAKTSRIHVAVLYRDPGHALDELIDSLLRQEQAEFDVVFIDNGSAGDARARLPLDDPRFTLVRRETPADPSVALRSFVAACDDDDVVFLLGADDRLANPAALAVLGKVFEDPACQLHYGQFRTSSGSLGNAEPSPGPAAFASSGPSIASRSPIAFRARLGRSADSAPLVDHVWRQAGFSGTRFSDTILTIAAEPRPAVPQAAVTANEEPLLSCLLVTRDRLSLVKRAIRSYADQTWSNRELVIVTDGTARFRNAIERFVSDFGIEGVRIIVPERDDLPLGALRNLSLDSARGEIVCQWDDDDCSHPDRLRTQAAFMLAQKARACFLTDHLQYLEDQRCVFWIDWTMGGTLQGTQQLAPGTLMMFNDARFRYPEEGENARRGEDSALLEAIYAAVPVAHLKDMGHLYLYQWHGRNTFPREHHYRMSTCGAARPFLHARAATIKSVLRYYDLARPTTVAGPDGPAFVV